MTKLISLSSQGGLAKTNQRGVSIESTKRKILSLLILASLLMSTVIMFVTAYVAATDGVERPIRVACIGDSITRGSGYTSMLQDELGENYAVKNFGVDGSAVTIDSIKPYMEQAAFFKALDYKPDVIVIMLGTNDANEKNYENIHDFSRDYESLIEAFRRSTSDEQIYLVEPPPVLENGLNITDANLVEGVIPQIARVADNLGLPTINIHSAISNSSDYFFDGVHPNEDGATIIANAIDEAISQDNAYPNIDNVDIG